MGVSASGRDVRIGGSTRQAAQQSKKDKGKGNLMCRYLFSALRVVLCSHFSIRCAYTNERV